VHLPPTQGSPHRIGAPRRRHRNLFFFGIAQNAAWRKIFPIQHCEPTILLQLPGQYQPEEEALESLNSRGSTWHVVKLTPEIAQRKRGRPTSPRSRAECLKVMSPPNTSKICKITAPKTQRGLLSAQAPRGPRTPPVPKKPRRAVRAPCSVQRKTRPNGPRPVGPPPAGTKRRGRPGRRGNRLQQKEGEKREEEGGQGRKGKVLFKWVNKAEQEYRLIHVIDSRSPPPTQTPIRYNVKRAFQGPPCLTNLLISALLRTAARRIRGWKPSEQRESGPESKFPDRAASMCAAQ